MIYDVARSYLYIRDPAIFSQQDENLNKYNEKFIVEDLDLKPIAVTNTFEQALEQFLLRHPQFEPEAINNYIRSSKDFRIEIWEDTKENTFSVRIGEAYTGIGGFKNYLDQGGPVFRILWHKVQEQGSYISETPEEIQKTLKTFRTHYCNE